MTESNANLVVLLNNSGDFIYSNNAFLKAIKLGVSNTMGLQFNALFYNSLGTTFEDIYDYCLESANGLKCMDLECKLPEEDWVMRSSWEFKMVLINNSEVIVGIGRVVGDYHKDNFDNLDFRISNSVSSNALISITDDRGRITMVNDNFCGFTRFNRSELIGHRHQDVFEDMHTKDFWKDMIDTLRRGQPWINEVNLKSKYGEVLWFHTFISPIHDRNGNLVQLLYVQFNITGHKKLAEEKIELFNKYNKITANLPGFVYQYMLEADNAHYFPFLTEGVSELYDLPPDILRIDASPAFSKVHPDDLDSFRQSIRESANSLTIWNHVFRICRSETDIIWVQGIATPERMENGNTLWHGFNYDITDRKASEEQLMKHQKQLDEIAFIQAHEFRRPVANMLGIFDILVLDRKKKAMSLEQIEHWLGLMYESVKETDEIIARIVNKAAEEEMLEIEEANRFG